MPAPDQSDLFSDDAPRAEWPAAKKSAQQPLAARMRPRNLSEVVGQTHLLKPGSCLPRLVAQNRFGSLLLLRPARCGKTSIAEAIARETQSRFVRVNAVMSNVAELREILAAAPPPARGRDESSSSDELHRSNKSQQDLLLPDVEEGTVRLIGGPRTTPGFYVNPPLLSAQSPFSTRAARARGDHRRAARGADRRRTRARRGAA